MNGVQAKLARAAVGIGIRELSEIVSVAGNTISRFENGDGSASGATIDAIEAYYLGLGFTFASDANTISISVPRDLERSKSGRAGNNPSGKVGKK